MGEMLLIDWEAHATNLANESDDCLAAAVQSLVKTVGADLTMPATVIVGRDTRASSAPLSIAVCDGVGAMQPSAVRSLGLVSTPQLHYVVRCQNSGGAYGHPSCIGYVNKLATA